MKYWELLDIDEKTRKALRLRDSQNRQHKIMLLFVLVGVVIFSYYFFREGFISNNAFELIFTAVVGGFVGSSITFIINSTP